MDTPPEISVNSSLPSKGIRAFFSRIFLREKLFNTTGILFFAAFGLFFSLLVAKLGFVPGALLLITIVAIPALYAIVVYPKVGIVILLSFAYFIMWFIRMGVNFPLGTLMDGLQALLILGFFIKQKTNPEWGIYKNALSFSIILWIVYNLLEFANPVASSLQSWMYTIRSVAIVMLTYFVFLYHIKTVSFIKLIFKLWLVFALFAAIYAFKQEYFGFFNFELNDLDNEDIRALYFIDGHWRKFSIFSDPVAYAYNMVSATMLCAGLISGPIRLYKKIILSILAMFFLFTMLSSGTRGAYVLVPVTLLMIAVLNYSKTALKVLVVAGFFIGALIFMPTSNPALVRFQSAFRPSNDASFNLRKINQKRIQPYIQTHPIGGGLGSTGVWGQRFAPNSYLAHFPPDSGYVRVAVENGWIGMLIFCTFMFLVLKTGIDCYYKIKSPQLKSYCLAMILIAFALNIGNYPQEALVQFPTNIYFYLVVALMQVLLRIDQQNNPEQKSLVLT